MGLNCKKLLQEQIPLQGSFRDPHDWRQPYSDLQKNTDDLGQIPEKHHKRAGRVAQSQHQGNDTEGIIKNLNIVQIRKTAVKQIKNARSAPQKTVYKQRGQNLYDRKHTDVEHHLFTR